MSLLARRLTPRGPQGMIAGDERAIAVPTSAAIALPTRAFAVLGGKPRGSGRPMGQIQRMVTEGQDPAFLGI